MFYISFIFSQLAVFIKRRSKWKFLNILATSFEKALNLSFHFIKEINWLSNEYNKKAMYTAIQKGETPYCACGI